jgi:hypothetical protein
MGNKNDKKPASGILNALAFFWVIVLFVLLFSAYHKRDPEERDIAYRSRYVRTLCISLRDYKLMFQMDYAAGEVKAIEWDAYIRARFSEMFDPEYYYWIVAVYVRRLTMENVVSTKTTVECGIVYINKSGEKCVYMLSEDGYPVDVPDDVFNNSTTMNDLFVVLFDRWNVNPTQGRNAEGKKRKP